ncbi:MAG: hypothetical protein EP344_10685 [Bacteroidetes bacterium]|nr:MAG: hypothetical protein EP344_10685 [Bacteroidota bacterium]
MKLNLFKRSNLQQVLLLCLVLLGSSITMALANGPDQEFTKKINREFGTTADGMTALYNKYGKVHVNTWKNNSVKIDITIIVNANNQRDADKLFERINVNFTNTSGYIKAETVVDTEGKNWWPGNSCQDFKINYEVWMPKGNQLDLKNKYGNSYVADLDGKLTAEIRYGDLRTETINNDADLSVGYGKATLARVRNLSGYLSYGGLILTDAKDVQVDSKYSEFQVDRAANVRITSKYDDFNLGDIQDLRVQTKYANLRVKNAQAAFVTAQYTDVKVNNVSGTMDADLTYGSLKVEALARDFSEAKIVGKYTDVSMNVESGATFRFDAEGTHTDLHTPSGATISSRDEKGSRSAVTGFVGDANAPRVVKARLSYGDFVLK